MVGYQGLSSRPRKPAPSQGTSGSGTHTGTPSRSGQMSYRRVTRDDQIDLAFSSARAVSANGYSRSSRIAQIKDREPPGQGTQLIDAGPLSASSRGGRRSFDARAWKKVSGMEPHPIVFELRVALPGDADLEARQGLQLLATPLLGPARHPHAESRGTAAGRLSAEWCRRHVAGSRNGSLHVEVRQWLAADGQPVHAGAAFQKPAAAADGIRR